MAAFLAFCGSVRKDSFNQKTLDCVAAALRAEGATTTSINLNDFPMPAYNGDEEESNGLPAAVRQFQTLLHEHDALLIGCPEYNGFMTPMLINAIDWATRSSEASPDLSCFAGKPVLVTSCSPGAWGGLRAAAHLKTMLSGIGCIVSPDNFMIPGAFSAFDDSGKLKDEKLHQRAKQVASRFSELTNRLLAKTD
jgi:chromate reductase, NAD(P)H dehydrogenase (quinone)